jgi:hypothetical protein
LAHCAKGKLIPRFELGFRDSKSHVLTTAPYEPVLYTHAPFYLLCCLQPIIFMLLNKYAHFSAIAKDDTAEELLFKIEKNIGLKASLEEKAFAHLHHTI